MESITLKAIESNGVLNNFWHFELLKIGENSVSISNIVIAVILSLLAIKFANKIYKIIANFTDSRLSEDKNNANLVKTIAFYSIYSLFVLLILDVANIPLGIFAFIGGALAIAAGLGMQNIVNNFISGIIILLEKPIKIGDIVDSGGIVGKVKSIGVRCTIIQSNQNVDVLVPNSKMMQRNLANWNYGSNKFQFEAIITFYRENYQNKKQYLTILDKLDKAIEKVSFIMPLKNKTRAQLVSIGKEEDKYSLIFTLDKKYFGQLDEIKNEINLNILNADLEQISITYKSKLA